MIRAITAAPLSLPGLIPVFRKLSRSILKEHDTPLPVALRGDECLNHVELGIEVRLCRPPDRGLPFLSG
jgi:hypothetical protein